MRPPRGRHALDLTRHAPPDLAVEVDVTHSSVPRVPIHAALGMPEVWGDDGHRLIVLLRDADGQYHEAARSVAFPDLPMDVLNRSLQGALTGGPHGQHEATIAFLEWLRESPTS